MTLSDVLLGLDIAWTDGPAIRDFIKELNTNPICIRGISAMEHALNAYHIGSSDGNKEITSPPPVDLHAVIKTLQQHVDAGPQSEGPENPQI